MLLEFVFVILYKNNVFIVENELLDKYTLQELLNSDVVLCEQLFEASEQAKAENIGRKTYFRGLIELSNKCRKDCFYCGIRCSNREVHRYELSDEEVLECALFAKNEGYGSIVIQAGENTSSVFTKRITHLIDKIMGLTNGELGLTLSLGEQSKSVYKEWRDVGAERYLLRIESSNKQLFEKIHPNDSSHRFDDRVKALHCLKECDYQVGSGVMIGLPFQTIDDLAADLQFLKHINIDMCGMGPYLEHAHTPLYSYRDMLQPLEWRKDMTLKMISILRLMMPTINIAATTALESIDAAAREKAIKIGANVVMPNVTPRSVVKSYKLYENKPVIVNSELIARIEKMGDRVVLNEKGTSRHYLNRCVTEFN